MKKAIFAIGTVLALSSLAVAQRDTPRSGKVRSDGKVAAKGNANSSANAGGTAINAGTMLQGELQSTLDVNRSKVGDRVLLKTKKAVKQGKETIVPKGTQLVGRITDIARRSKDNSQSRIGILFDRIEGANLSRPITATIVSITRANASAGAGDNDVFAAGGLDSSTSGTGSIPAVTRPSSGGGGGGLLGSATQGLVSTAGGVTNTVANTARTATGTVGNTVNSAGSTIRNIDLTSSVSGSAGSVTTLSSNDKNFRIEKGATFNLRVGN